MGSSHLLQRKFVSHLLVVIEVQVFAMVRLFAASTVLLYSEATALRRSKAEMTLSRVADELDRSLVGSGFWPFTSATVDVPQAVPTAAPEKRKTVFDAKQALISSKIFQEKTAELCRPAKADISNECHKVAQDRLFCTMFTRHQKQFTGMDGVAEEKEDCSKVDIMITVVEAAKDMKEKEDAAADGQ